MIKLSEILELPSISKFEFIDLDKMITGGAIDSREVKDGYLYFSLKGRNTDGHNFIGNALEENISAAIVEVGYDNANNFPVIYSNDVEITMREIASFWRSKSKAKIIAITGSNGKTTTKEMLYEILKDEYKTIRTLKNYNNHQGVPLTLLNIKEDTEYAIIEMGANHHGEISYLSTIVAPDMGIITNIGDAHLEFFGSREGVKKAKEELFEYIHDHNGIVFVNSDDEYLRDWNKGNVVTYGSSVDSLYNYSEVGIDEYGNGEFNYNNYNIKLSLPGVLNVKNAIAATTIAKYIGVEDSVIKEKLKNFKPYDKRYEEINYKNSKVILDCYNANPSSMKGIINDMAEIDENYIYILGDMFELGESSKIEHRKIGLLFNDIKYKKLLLIGEDMKNCYDAIEDKSRVKFFHNIDELQVVFNLLTNSKEKIIIKASRGLELERLVK
ncbi:MAG: UDP-N-acetylmuramoyl-tripeptide--D-alanyl-D-alanine ligase [Candidatus Delongbacteria bacterium]|jgi:UDP-N-acetylmuramoyl-tripeptide--D-alanyl-D-alanine ligase|nr:UDP-N-acetylmuramoyl-tripeptide--D-alanyl-D-alanine ligase [Candidatus Delongbacteria bacterium]